MKANHNFRKLYKYNSQKKKKKYELNGEKLIKSIMKF